MALRFRSMIAVAASGIALAACQGARDTREPHPRAQEASDEPTCEPVHVYMADGREQCRAAGACQGLPAELAHVALPNPVYVPSRIAVDVVKVGKVAATPTVELCVDERGALTAGRIVQSSGFPALDQWVMGSLLHVESSTEHPTGAPGCAVVVLALRRFECYWPPFGTSTSRP
jgi:hypothetical protein